MADEGVIAGVGQGCAVTLSCGSSVGGMNVAVAVCGRVGVRED